MKIIVPNVVLTKKLLLFVLCKQKIKVYKKGLDENFLSQKLNLHENHPCFFKKAVAGEREFTWTFQNGQVTDGPYKLKYISGTMHHGYRVWPTGMPFTTPDKLKLRHIKP